MEKGSNIDDENPDAHAYRIAPISAPRPPSRPSSSSAQLPQPIQQEATALPPPSKTTRTGTISPSPTPFASDAPVISTAPELTGKTVSKTPASAYAPALAAMPASGPTRTRIVRQAITEPILDTPASAPVSYTPSAPISNTPASAPVSVPVAATISTRPVNSSQTTPTVPTPESDNTSTIPPKPEQPPTREPPASAPAPKVQNKDKDKDKHKVGKRVAEAATTAATVGGFGVGVVDTALQAGNGNNTAKPPETSSEPGGPGSSCECWEDCWELCEGCCDC